MSTKKPAPTAKAAPKKTPAGKAPSTKAAPAEGPTAKVAPTKPCPICGKAAVERYRPFCSKRCADIDLNRWLTGAYAIPVVEEEDEDGEMPGRERD